MNSRARESYLESQILTATPQKLRLLLIQAALGAARKTLAYWEDGNETDAVSELIQCRNVITELLQGIQADDSELTKRVTGIYVFLFKALTEAQLHRDVKRLSEVIEVLEVEQETWRQVCEKLPHHIVSGAEGVPAPAGMRMRGGEAEQPPASQAAGSPGFVVDA